MSDPDEALPVPRPRSLNWKFALARVAGAAFLLLAIFVAGRTFWLEPRSLIVRRETVPLEGWSQLPVRVGLISDTHTGSPFNGIEKLKRVVDLMNRERPDVVVLLGDYVIQGVAGGRFVSPEEIARELGRLRAPLGVYAVLGNHDWWLDAGRVARSFRAAGVAVIDGRAIRLKSGGEGFWLVGVSDFVTGPRDLFTGLREVNNMEPILLATHNPDLFPWVPNRVRLTVAGHTHGGQVKLPVVGRLVVPSTYGQRYAAGHVQENGRNLFVTTGVGTSILPVRFGVPPEIVILTLEGRVAEF